MEKDSSKGILWQLSWVLILLFLLMLLTYSYFLLTYFDRGLNTATSVILSLEAQAYAKSYQKDPAAPLKDGGQVELYKDWETLPVEFRENFSEKDMQHNEMEVLKAENFLFFSKWWSDNLPERWGRSFILTYNLNNGEKVYAIFQLNKDELSSMTQRGLINNIHETLPIALLFIFLVAGFVYWLSQRINQAINKLSTWILQLNDEDCKLLPPDFNDKELNKIAGCVQATFLKVNRLIEREHYFLRHASHELRTPVAVTKASLQLMSKQGLYPHQYSSFKRLQRANKNMQHLIETLLWSSRETTAAPEYRDVNVALLLQEQLEDLKYLLEGKLVEVRSEILTEELTQYLPATPLRIVFANLIRNAYQHTSQGSVTISLQRGLFTIHNCDEQHDFNMLGEDNFGLGLVLVRDLCGRLGWSLKFECKKREMQVVVNYEGLKGQTQEL